MTDKEIKTRIARHLDLGFDRIAHDVLDRTSEGHLIARPEVVHG